MSIEARIERQPTKTLPPMRSWMPEDMVPQSLDSIKRDQTPGARIRIVPFQSSEITKSITKARDMFVASEKKKDRTVVAYDFNQDRAVYRELAKHTEEEGYEAAKDSLNAYTRMQIETHLGERLHVGISKFHFAIHNGELMADNANEPMLSVMRRGRDYRRDHGLPVDWSRESAEVFGFEETQRVLTNPETPIGTMMLSISPRGDVENGSIYKQNFYDVYQKTEDGVVAYRYTSGLTREETQEKIRTFDDRYDHDYVPNDVQYLAQPIRFDPDTSPFRTPEEIHAYLHKEHEFMDQEEFRQTIEICTPMITSLINSLCNNPEALLEHEKNEIILLNAVDEIIEKNQKGEIVLFQPKGGDGDYVRPWVPTAIDINRLLNKEVREVDTGCGSSGGKNSKSLFSVSEAAGGGEYTGDNAKFDPNLCRCGGKEPHFHCPGNGGSCGHAIIVGEGTSSCPNCGTGQVC